MRWVAIALAFATLCAAPRAQTAVVEKAEILWAGIYRASIIGTVDQPDTAIGRTNQLGNIEKLENTTTVPARIGINFGFEYRLAGTSEGTAATVRIVVIPPKSGLLNPETQQRVYRETWSPSAAFMGATTLVGYLLEKDWELVPGLWKFEVWNAERKIGEQSFCLVEDAPPDKSADNRKAQEERCHSAATA